MQIQCTVCNETFDLNVSEEQLREWNKGTLIQDAMPHLTAAERELFITGFCGKCFDELYKEPVTL